VRPKVAVGSRTVCAEWKENDAEECDKPERELMQVLLPRSCERLGAGLVRNFGAVCTPAARLYADWQFGDHRAPE